MSRSQTFGRKTRLRGAKAKLKFSLMKQTGKFDKLTFLILEVQKKTLSLGLVKMIWSSILDSIGIWLTQKLKMLRFV